MHELCRFRRFAISKPAKFRGLFIEPGKVFDDVFTDVFCRFAGLIPVGEAQNT
jgi:hypothetical protein